MTNQIAELALVSGLKKFLSSWYVWLFPAFALALTGWLIKQYYIEQGPTILIRFEDASSLQPEKTPIRHRGVMIGTVKQVTLAKDNQDVLVYARLSKEAEQFAVSRTVFSLVSPKVGLEGVSGIETIFDGVYISAHPGPPQGKTQLEFIGTVGKDVSFSLQDTVPYYLEAPRAGAISPGDNVTFRDVQVGTVSDLTFSKTSQSD